MKEKKAIFKNGTYKEPEITTPTFLCTKNGKLNPSSIGWSRTPLHICNLKGNWLRKKKWNHWLIASKQCLFVSALFSSDYLGLAFSYIYEFASKKYIEKSLIIPLSIGCNLPDTVDGNISFKSKEFKLNFLKIDKSIKITTSFKTKDNPPVKADILVSYPIAHETLNVVIPWSKDKFHFTSKQNCLPAEGNITVGDKIFNLDSNNTFASHDFGRGIWKYSSFWNWASGSGIVNDKNFGFNLGAIWTKGSGMTENAILYNSKIYKISEDVKFSYKKNKILEPWNISSKTSNQIDIEFVPFYDRMSKTNALILKSSIHQVFGKFSGIVRLENEKEIKFENIIGIAEEHFARW